MQGKEEKKLCIVSILLLIDTVRLTKCVHCVSVDGAGCLPARMPFQKRQSCANALRGTTSSSSSYNRQAMWRLSQWAEAFPVSDDSTHAMQLLHIELMEQICMNLSVLFCFVSSLLSGTCIKSNEMMFDMCRFFNWKSSTAYFTGSFPFWS